VTVGESEEKQDGNGKGEDDDSQEANHASLIRPTAKAPTAPRGFANDPRLARARRD
jgi:hypothetical protein